MAGGPAGYDVFLSYSRADQAAANALRDRLAQDGNLKVFIDWRALSAGRPWQPALESALSGCRAMIVLVGPKGIGGWQHREIQLGLDRQTGAEKTPTPFPVIPVLLPGLEPDGYPLGTFLALNTWVTFDRTVDEPLPLQHLLSAIHGQSLDAPRDFASLRPYRGLLAFREQDAGLFFGRERFVEELTAKVRQRSDTNVVAVLGRSGSGKSSVVFAGLFPALQQESVWQILDLRPGAEPLHALIETFDPPDENLTRIQKLATINAGVELMRQGTVTLAQLVRDRLKDDPGTTRLLLYVDQWEELYTQAQKREPITDEDKARAADARLFTNLVLDAAAKSPCTLVLSVRSDFYPDLQAHDALRAAVQDYQVSLGPMTAAELTAAVEGPAKAVGGSVEAELSKKLRRDIGLATTPGAQDHYDIGKLPLLEYALEQAWAKVKDGRIGLAHYAGLEQALEDRADDIYDRLPPDQKAAAKRLFVSLVTPGEGHEDTRARITLPANSTLEQVAASFAAKDARLIVTGDNAGGARSAEVSHEALIRHWAKLRIWIDENRANLRTRSVLIADRGEWLKQNRDRSLLIEPGLRLEAARRLQDHPGDVETADLQDYLNASFRADAKRKFRRNLGLGASIVAAISMGVLAAWGWYQYTEAARRADETTAALIWMRLDFEDPLSPKSPATVEALWDIAGASAGIRDAFLRQLALDRYQVDTLASSPASIGRAFGIRPKPGEIARLLGPVLNAIPKTTHRNQLWALVQTVATLGPKLAPEQAQAALGPILDAIRQTSDPQRLSSLAEAVQALGPTPEQARAALGAILDAIPEIDDRSFLTPAVAALGRTHEQVQAILGPILDALAKTLATLSPAPEHAQYALGRTVDMLAEAVATLGPRLVPEQARAALGPILDAISKTNDPYALISLAKAIATLGPKLAPEQARAAVGPMLDAITRMARTDDILFLPELAKTFTNLGPTAEQAQAAVDPILDAIPNDSERTFQRRGRELLKYRAQAVTALGPKLAPEQAQAALGPILHAIPKTSDDGLTFEALAQAVATLGPRLEPQQTGIMIEASRSLLAVQRVGSLENSVNNAAIAVYFARAIAETLPAEQPQPYVAAIIELLKWPTTAGPAANALLEVLHERVPGAPGKDAGLEATVQWVAATYPEIDLDSPPTPPASGSTGGAW